MLFFLSRVFDLTTITVRGRKRSSHIERAREEALSNTQVNSGEVGNRAKKKKVYVCPMELDSHSGHSREHGRPDQNRGGRRKASDCLATAATTVRCRHTATA